MSRDDAQKESNALKSETLTLLEEKKQKWKVSQELEAGQTLHSTDAQWLHFVLPDALEICNF